MELNNELTQFLEIATQNWDQDQIIKQFTLNENADKISCILWETQFLITGSDIIKIINTRMQIIGRYIKQVKKFEEGIYSDLRNLKVGLDAILEPAHSPLLRFLNRYQCIRTQKKQKLFYWFSVNHMKLFMDALERDIKREALGIESSTFDLNYHKSFTWSPDSFSTNPNALATNFGFSNTYHDFGKHCSTINSTQLMNFQDNTLYSSPKNTPQLSFMSPILNNGSYPAVHPSSLDLFYPSSFESMIYKENKSPNHTYLDLNVVNALDSDLDKLDYFKCDHLGCDKKFKRKEHLRRHQFSHTGKRPFECDMLNCTRAFSRKDNLVQHLKTHKNVLLN